MEKFDIEKKEIFSLLTSKQIAELSEIAVIINFQEEQIIYDRKETASNLFVLLEGEVSLRIPGTKDSTTEDFSLEIEKVIHHGELFGTNFLFDVNTYKTRAKVVKPSKVMILDANVFCGTG